MPTTYYVVFLEFLKNPDQLRWPLVRGKRRQFGSEVTMRQREALVDGPDKARAAAVELGLERLRTRGARGTQAEPAWWVFEGETKVDCVLMTARLALFIEGKRTEILSSSTDWYPSRNQLSARRPPSPCALG